MQRSVEEQEVEIRELEARVRALRGALVGLGKGDGEGDDGGKEGKSVKR